jgi:hypothetical protein
MKYKDRHTIKSNYQWQNKPNDFDNNGYLNVVKNSLKRSIIPFGKKINDTFWWNSLTQKEKMSVYVQYCEFEYYFGDDNWYTLPHITDHVFSHIPTFPDLTEEEHENRINTLKDKYSNNSKRRDLIINDILR